jgi:hypothetical protein
MMTPEDWNHALDEARTRAHALRQAAIAQAWDWLLSQTMHPLRPARSAARLGARLRRRAHAPAGGQPCQS